MKVFKKIVDLQNELFLVRKEGKEIGLVPTMGALHEGHASLIKRSVKENGATVVSIFLNPTQFNDKGDLERYPRTLEADCKLCEACGAQYVFAPSVEEMYPTPDTRHFEFPPQSTVMEGAKRPGHFNGVCQVVSRLFFIVKPNRAYFGEKDWQQIAVVKRLVNYIGYDKLVHIVECPIVRDADGLAKSSRNTLLTPEERAIAPHIYQALKESVEYAKTHGQGDTRQGGSRHQCRRWSGGRILRDRRWEYAVGCQRLERQQLCSGLHHRLLRTYAYPPHRPHQI